MVSRFCPGRAVPDGPAHGFAVLHYRHRQRHAADRCQRSAQGAKHPRAEVVEYIGGQADKDGLDIGLDIVFILTFRMDVFGAALATVLSQALAGVGCLRGQPHAAGHIPAQLLVVARAELLGHGYGEPGAYAAAEAHHQKIPEISGLKHHFAQGISYRCL